MSEAQTQQPSIWIISLETWPRALLRAELIEQGYDARGYLTIEQALVELMRNPAGKPQVIILDLNAQTITHALLSALEREGVPTVILGGAVELNDPVTSKFAWAGVLRRPFTVGEVATLIKRLAPGPV
jgi:DNA-binding response OmpR family regulator